MWSYCELNKRKVSALKYQIKEQKYRGNETSPVSIFACTNFPEFLYSANVLRSKKILALFLAFSFVLSSVAHAHVPSVDPPILEPTKTVITRPLYGFYNGPIRTRLSKSEVDAIRRLQWIATTWIPRVAVTAIPVTWLIEEGTTPSPTLAIAIDALAQAKLLQAREDGKSLVMKTIILARSQKFIRDTLISLNCNPDLSRTYEQYLMGATVCNRRVIVINLTGYYYLTNPRIKLTTELETLPEPALKRTNYLIVNRNISSLAHEWTHVVRDRPTVGSLGANEPVWLREGMAEVVSGLSLVRASKGKMTYEEYHVIRIRKFSNWPNQCRLSLTEYRETSVSLGGCEYLRGAAAIELLLAGYGGIGRVQLLYEDANELGDFEASFQRVYGMTLREFEVRADQYSQYIIQAGGYR